MRVQPRQQSKQIVGTKRGFRIPIRCLGRGKLIACAALKKRTDIQIGRVLGWQQCVATEQPEVFADSIEIYGLGKTALAMELDDRQSLRKRQIFFMDKAFVGCQDKHSSVGGTADLLQDLEGCAGKQYRGRRQPAAIGLQYVIPGLHRITIRWYAGVLVRKL